MVNGWYPARALLLKTPEVNVMVTCPAPEIWTFPGTISDIVPFIQFMLFVAPPIGLKLSGVDGTCPEPVVKKLAVTAPADDSWRNPKFNVTWPVIIFFTKPMVTVCAGDPNKEEK